MLKSKYSCYKIVAVGKQVCKYMSKTHMLTDESQKSWKMKINGED